MKRRILESAFAAFTHVGRDWAAHVRVSFRKSKMTQFKATATKPTDAMALQLLSGSRETRRAMANLGTSR